MKSSLRSFLLTAAVAATCIPANAALIYWDGSAGPSFATGWETEANWSTAANLATPNPSAVPGASDRVVFGTSIIASGTNQTVNLNADQSALGLAFGNNSPQQANITTYLLQGGGTARTLTIGASGIILTRPIGAVTIGGAAGQAVNLSLAGSQTWTNLSDSLLTIKNNVTNNSTSSPLTLTIAASGPATPGGTTINGVISDNTASGTVALTVATRGGSGLPGNVALTGNNTYSGATTVQAGRLVLDYSVTGGSFNGIINNGATDNLTAKSSLILGGGALFSINTPVNAVAQSYTPFLQIKAAAAGTNIQYFKETTLQAGPSSIVLEANGASTLTASLGAITRNGTATLNISNSNGSVPGTLGNNATTSSSNVNGILGTWATVGNGAALDYATVTSGNIVALGAGATTATANLANVSSATTNYSLALAGSQTLTSNQTGNTLRTTDAGISTLSLGANTLTLNGLMHAGSNVTASQLVVTSSGAGSLATGSSGELVLTGYGATSGKQMDIRARITGAGNVTLTSVVPYGTDNRGQGFRLAGANTYTGTTTLNYGYVDTSTAASVLSIAATEVAGVSSNLGNGGNITFSGGSLRMQNQADYSARIRNSTSAIALSFTGTNVVTYNSAIDSSNTGGLVVGGLGSDRGQLTLNGANAYTGDTIIGPSSGAIVLGNKSAFGNGGTVYNSSLVGISANTDLSGTNKIMNNFVNVGTSIFKGGNNIEFGGIFTATAAGMGNSFIYNDIDGGLLEISGNFNLSTNTVGGTTVAMYGRGNTTISGVIANNIDGTANAASVIFGSTGTTTLTAANTYSGPTQVLGGTLALDFSAAGAPANNILQPITISLNSGTLKLIGSGTQANVQTNTSSVTGPASGASRIVMVQNGQDLLLDFSNLTRLGNGSSGTLGGSTLDITLSGTSTATNGVRVSSTSVDAGGLLKGFTVGGNDWATKGTGVTANNVLAVGSAGATPLGVYTVAAAVGSGNWTTTKNIDNTGVGAYTGSLGANATINTLRFNDNSAGGVGLGTSTLIVNDGILITSAVNNKALTISGGNLRSLGGTASNGDLLVINRGTDGTTLDISSTIVDNGTNLTSVSKSGTGTVTLSGTNTYTGNTFLNEGVLKAQGGGLSTANLVLNGGVLGLTADFTRALGQGANQVQWNSRNISGGFAAYGADRTVNLGGASAEVTWNGGSFVFNGGSLILGASDADAMVDFQNNIKLGNSVSNDRTVQVNNGSAAIDAKLSGIINGNTSVGLVKTGAGTLWLSAANTYSGETLVLDGTLTITSGAIVTGSLNGNSSIRVNGSNAIFDLGNNHSQVSTGQGAFNGIIVENGGSITGTGTSSLTGLFYDMRSGSASAILAGTGAFLNKTTSGTVTLTGNNTYTGGTTVSAGTLLVSNAAGSGTGTGSLSVSSGAILGGTGTIAPTGANSLSVSGIVAPGATSSIGNLTINLGNTTGNVTMLTGATFAFDITGGTPNLSDRINLLGTAANGDFVFNNNVINFTLSGSLTNGQSYLLFDGSTDGQFTGLTLSGNQITGGLSFTGLSGAFQTDSTLTLVDGDIIFNAIPEPSTWMLIALGLTFVVMRRRATARG